MKKIALVSIIMMLVIVAPVVNTSASEMPVESPNMMNIGQAALAVKTSMDELRQNVATLPPIVQEVFNALCGISDNRAAVVAEAEFYVGKLQYDLIGDASDLKKGVADCSGFVYRIFEAADLKSVYGKYATCQEIMGRTQKSDSGFVEIPVEDLLPGDLVIYANSEKYQQENPGRVYGHVAIYVGDGMVIHTTRNDSGYTGCVKTVLNYRNIPMERIHGVRVINE